MTRLRLAYVHRFRDRHGLVRHYFRRDGYARVALPGLPGSTEFMEAYQAALRGIPLSVGAGKTKAGTISALAVAYYESADFKRLNAHTKIGYRRTVENFRKKHGDKPVAAMEPRHVRGFMDDMAATPHAANHLRTMLRLMMRFAVERGWRRDDPMVSVRRLRAPSEGFHTWTEEEIAAFEAKWPLGTRARLAMALLLYTGQRRGDVVRMGRQHLRGGTLDVVQGKTGARLAIPLHAELRAALEHAPAQHLTFVTTRLGAPFTPGAFTTWFVGCAVAAGLNARCTPHGLRKAAARRLAEAGCSTHQIAAITGHATLKEVERYTRAASQADLAEAAIVRIGSKRANE